MGRLSTTQLFVGRVSLRTTARTIQDLLRNYGEIKDFQMKKYDFFVGVMHDKVTRP